MVGINPTRQGEELARDIRHTDCQLIVTESHHLPLLDGLDVGVDRDRILVVDDPAYAEVLAPYRGAALPDRRPGPETQYLLLFTSGTTGAPKAVITCQRRCARPSKVLSDLNGLTQDSVAYQVMPMFHSNALFAGWGPALYAGAAHALRRKFSASNFLPDVRRFGATYFNYVGKPLSYILATPEQPDDADNPLVYVFGNEAADHDIDRFAQRFGCVVRDGFGSTEMGASIQRVEGMPKGSLGAGGPDLYILDPETNEERPRARFDDEGRLLNAEEAIGEIVNKDPSLDFEGYYKNPEANAKRRRNGWYWSGDLGYRDSDGWFYFAGRDDEWVRVDGENFGVAPVERILARYPGVQLASVYAVPDEEVGDQLMAALQLDDPDGFDPEAFDAFLRDQSDLGTKWTPRYLRVTGALPMSHSNKVLKRRLRLERWHSDEMTYWRPHRGEPLQPMTDTDRDELRNRFAARDRLSVLERL